LPEKLLLATSNQAKISEYRSLLAGLPCTLVTPAEMGIALLVREAGNSYRANAGLKAAAFARQTRLLSLADDSGLEVDALGGKPGHLSARYAGENATDAGRISRLLEALKTIPREKRTARFRCVIALARPGGQTIFCSGECRGLITEAPRGSHGFGYDPVFFLPELGKTMAELSPEEKNRISHRAMAAKKAREALKKLAGKDIGN